MRQAGTSSRLTTLIVVAIVAGTFIAGIITRAQREEHGPIDLIVLNGKVYAGDGKTFAEAVAVQGNKIVLVGSNRDIKRLRRPQTTVLDAHGSTVLPGLNDAYVHFVEGSLALMTVDLTGALTVDDVGDRLRAYAEEHTDGDWITGRGWDPAVFGPGAITRDVLDTIAPGRPVYLTSSDGHAAWTNSAALKLANVTRATRNPRRGVIVKNRTGEPTGLLKDAAMELVERVIPAVDDDDKLDALRAGVEEAHRVGITSVQNAGAESRELSSLDELRSTGELKLRVYQSIAVPDTASDADLDRLAETRLQYGDDPLLKTGSAEITVDAATRDGLSRLITALDRRGWQVWVRAASEQAVHWALDSFQAATDANPAPVGGRRHRIEHGDMLSPATADRFSRLGVITAVPPVAASEDLAMPTTKLVFGSEWPSGPLDPRTALREAFSYRGEGPDTAPAAIPAPLLRTALDAYTSGGAYASFDDQRKGKLAPGMLADIVILSGDIFSTPPEQMLEVKVDVTIFDGEVVYTRAD